MRYPFKQSWCQFGPREYVNMTRRLVVPACSTTCLQSHVYPCNINSAVYCMICTLTNQAKGIMINSLAAVQLSRDSGYYVVYQDQRFLT